MQCGLCQRGDQRNDRTCPQTVASLTIRTWEARPDYVAAAVKPADPPPEVRRIDQKMLSADTLDEVPVTFSTEPATTPPGKPGVHVVLHLDIAHLHLVNGSRMHTDNHHRRAV